MTTLDNQKRDWLDDRIEAHLDGDLKPGEVDGFDEIAMMDEDLARELNLARSISSTLASMPDESCPEEVTRGVMAHVRRDVRRSFFNRLRASLNWQGVARLKPAIAMALLLIVVLSSVIVGRNSPVPDAEVAQALADVKMALAYLSDAGRTTGTAVKQDIIGPLVVRPVARSMNAIIEN